MPIAIAGFDIKELVQGAIEMRKACIDDEKSIALEYAVARTALYRKGYAVELLANFNPKLHYITAVSYTHLAVPVQKYGFIPRLGRY